MITVEGLRQDMYYIRVVLEQVHGIVKVQRMNNNSLFDGASR
jgi:hypothetical protein